MTRTYIPPALQTDTAVLAKAINLPPLARRIVQYMLKTGSISARDAFLNLNETTSASLTRRMTDIEEAGIKIDRRRRTHTETQKPYTRYSLRDIAIKGMTT